MLVESKLELTPLTQKVINQAVKDTFKLNNGYVGTEHLLIGMVDEDASKQLFALTTGLNSELVSSLLQSICVRPPVHSIGPVLERNIDYTNYLVDKFTTRSKRVLNIAFDHSHKKNMYMGDLLFALVKEGEGVAAHVLDELDITMPSLKERRIVQRMKQLEDLAFKTGEPLKNFLATQ